MLELTALAIFLSYFLVIVALFSLILTSLPPLNTSRAKRHNIHAFQALTLVSFAHTWFYMFKFMAWSFLAYEDTNRLAPEGQLLDRMSSWLLNTGLFEQAWAAVCSGPRNWWWSEQLCLFTVGAWTVFVATEGRRHGVKHLWAYMLLGQVVAISVASNLFYLALIRARTAPRANPSPRMAPLALWASVLLSLVTVGAAPSTSPRTFLPNLLVMHALLLVPLIPLPRRATRFGRGRFSMGVGTLYTAVAVLGVALRVRTTAVAVHSLPGHVRSTRGFAASAWETLHSHPAQSSIGWDVIWTTLSFAAWILLGSHHGSSPITVPALVVANLLGSVGVTAPVFFFGGVDNTGEFKRVD